MRHIFFILFFSLFASSISSQSIRGIVTDENGDRLPGTSVFIQENNQGIVCNENGEFQVKLTPGTYHFEFRCIGYKSLEKEIKVDTEDIEITIKLNPNEILLAEVSVVPGEDPAYRIMREAIKKAPYYLSLVKECRYEVYIKGAGKVTYIPKLVEKMAGGEVDMDMYRNKLFMQESFSEITYKAPDQFDQKVIAFSNTFPIKDDPKSTFGMGMISLYPPMLGGAVSPLNPKAFDYYRFRYEGFLEEKGELINIIRIIPKLNDSQFFEGEIHIAEDEWNVRYARLLRNSGNAEYIFNFNRVKEDAFLITNYELHQKVNLGIKMEVNFLSSIQYTDIQLNDSLIAATEKEKPKKKKSLEIKRDDYYRVEADSLALKKDSTYWDNVRTVALNEEELNSYAWKDTIQAYNDSLVKAESNHRFSPRDLILGGSIGNDSSSLDFHYSGLLGIIPDYNFVDGLWLGQSFEFDFKKKKNTGLIIKPEAHWTLSRKALVWKMNASYDYAPKRLGKVSFKIAHSSEDYSGENGMNSFLNMSFTLFGGKNYKKYYDKKELFFSNYIDIFNGFRLGINLELVKRTSLTNTTTWNFFGIKDNWTPNRPDFSGPLHEEYSGLTKYQINLSYTPEYYYRMVDGKKRYVRSRFPTFGLDFQQGLDIGLLEHSSKFFRMEMNINQRINLGLFDRLDYTLAAGKFFNKNSFNYIDYKHFDIGYPYVSFKAQENTYILLPYYTYSTDKSWIQGFVNYSSKYLAIKRLPFLQGKGFSEVLQTKFLHTPDKKYYSEWGYGIKLMGGAASIGIFASFDSFDYNSAGFQLAMPLFDASKKGTREITISF